MWTSEKPAIEGWFWYKDEEFASGVIPVRIEYTGFIDIEDARQLDIVWPEEFDSLFEDLNGMWSGPIEAPAL